MIRPKIRPFVLEREEDESGVSGTGTVAEGVEFSNGSCAITWLTAFRAYAFYENIKALEAVHGHEGRTKIVFLDEDIKEEKNGKEKKPTNGKAEKKAQAEK